MLVRTQVLFPEAVLEELRVMAVAGNKSVSEIVRSVIEKFVIKKERKKISGWEAINRMIKHSYKGKDVPRDLSTNDEYLYGRNAP
ncbi:hypothetical protein KKE45_00060 [Patescibacteria group bacterium]|nr:hypothetical protein [Patescibacteria group bacterium]